MKNKMVRGSKQSAKLDSKSRRAYHLVNNTFIVIRIKMLRKAYFEHNTESEAQRVEREEALGGQKFMISLFKGLTISNSFHNVLPHIQKT